jgi:hypothetical protein
MATRQSPPATPRHAAFQPPRTRPRAPSGKRLPLSKNILIAMGVGIVCLALAVMGVLYMQRGAHLELPGKFLKARTAALDEKSSFVAIDFRISNPSDYPAVVRSVTIYLEDAKGERTAGQTTSDPDAKRVFDGIPLLGPKYNPSLVLRDKIAPKASMDRMVSARFEMPDPQLASRKRFIVSIEEVDGKVFEIAEN